MRVAQAIVQILIISALLPLAFAATGTNSNPTPPVFYVNTTMLTLCRGITNNIPITIVNPSVNRNDTGVFGDMEDAQMSIGSVKGLYSTIVQVGTINANSTHTTNLPVFVSANASGFISLPITINFYYFADEYTDSATQNLTFSTETCPQPLSLSVSPDVLTAGETQNLTVNFTNNGATTLNSIIAQIKFPGQFVAWLSNQQINVNSIAPGQTVQRDARIFVSYNATDEFEANMTAYYYNGSSLVQISQPVEMLASGLISLNTSGVTVSPTLPSSGSIFSISFTLTNTGTSAASSATATVVPTNGFTSFESNSTFIGSISADSQTPVTLTLEAGNRTKGTYHIPIKISYLNTVREPVNETIIVPVTVGAAVYNASSFVVRRQSSSGGSGIILIILVVIIIALGYLLYRERKKTRKQAK